MSVVLEKIDQTKDTFADIWKKVERNDKALLNYMNTYGRDLVEVDFVATKGQADFTLEQGSFIPGTGGLQVFVDNTEQFVGRGFSETSSTSIKLSEGLDAGQVVKLRYYLR